MSERSEGSANGFYAAFTKVSEFNGWRAIASQWLTHGEIDFPSLLALKQRLFDDNPKIGNAQFSYIKRWYYWANGLRIPGFTGETVDRLRALKGKGNVLFVAQEQIAPGRPKSNASKNRRCYTDVDFAKIQNALIRLEGRLNAGEIILANGNMFSLLAPHVQANIRENSQHIGTVHLVLGWLACQFGDRTKAYTKLRESDFTFIEVEGVKVGEVRFSDEIKRSYGKLPKPAKRDKLPLNVQLLQLVPRLMEENRLWAAKRGIDPDGDLPLFLAKRVAQGGTSPVRMTLEDESSRFLTTSGGLLERLKSLFQVLKIKTSDGTLINPTFYSFRDGNHTRWSRKMPLESVAAITGKKGIKSFKHYTKPGIRHIARLDEVPEYTELAEYMQPPVPTEAIAPQARIPAPFPYAEDGALRVGVEGGCGCFGSSCPMAFDGTTDCYVCHAFTPAVEGPHEWTLKVLLGRKVDMIDRGLPKSEWTRYDRHIAAVGRVVQLVREWRSKHLDME